MKTEDRTRPSPTPDERQSDTLLARARAMRREPSDAEQVLWRRLRARQLAGYKFRRQVIIGRYIVDFVCIDAGLVVEADGGQHAGHATYDTRRSAYLAGRGYKVLRFWNNEILGEMDSVLGRILMELE